jgi:signal transduction histidine kinase
MRGAPGRIYAGPGMNLEMRLPPLRPPAVLDAGLAVLLAVLSVLDGWQLLFPDPQTQQKVGYQLGSREALHWHGIVWLAAVAAEVAVLPLRRRYPVSVLMATVVFAAVHAPLLPVTPAPADLAVALAIYTVATALPRVTSAALVSGALLAVVSLEMTLPSGGHGGKGGFLWTGTATATIVPALVLAAAWFAGDSTRSRRVYLADAVRRARDAERDRDQRAELAAAAERERITSELHDVIAHALSVIVIQAQGAAAALRGDQAGMTGEALDAIVSTGRDALAETRRVLGLIRGPADPELAPLPGLADLPRLVAAVREAGTPVRLNVTGQPRLLPEGLELSAYRIVQEALTNTMRHAGPGVTAEVTVTHSASCLVIEVSDHGSADCPRTIHPGSGRGLAGMRARAAMLNGELTAGPAPGGGFLVRASLPVPELAGERVMSEERDTA